MIVNTKLRFEFSDTTMVSRQALYDTACARDLAGYITAINSLRDQWYQTPYASFALPYDERAFQNIEWLVVQKKQLNPSVVIVIGIGGSALGAHAIYQAIVGSFSYTFCASQDVPVIHFLQTIDGDHVGMLLKIIEQECKRGRAVLINVITKSGTTIETVVNFEVVIQLLKTYRDDYRDLIVVTSDEGSPLHACALQHQFAFLPIEKQVGGRFSVLSAVGLFCLSMAGINVYQLLAGARDALIYCLSTSLEENYAAQSALLLYLHHRQGVVIHDLFLFSVDLEVVGKWYRQLMGESIGKEFDIHGNRVYAGITPTVSLGTIDLHSVAQLYLGGPRDKYTTFVAVENGSADIAVQHAELSGLENKKLSYIMNAFLQGTQRAYQNNGRPFSTLILPEKNEYYLGQCMQYKMVEMVFLAYLLEVDAFDQPNVDLYKREVKKLLTQ